jgi:molybdopterin/thiamine biosynthesis adenylyltransferase
MAKITKTEVLVVGLTGLGVEYGMKLIFCGATSILTHPVAKNTILAGVKAVVLHDDEPTTYTDLSSQVCSILNSNAFFRLSTKINLQFYLSSSDIGKPRGAASLDKLAELNNYVTVSLHTGALDEAFISKFQV